MSNKLHRFIFENIHVRGEWVKLDSVWQEIQQNSEYPSPVRNVLGEALAAISLLAESLKLDGSLVLQIRGTQPVTMLVVQANSDGGLRGIAKWDGDIADNATFSDLFGKGTIVISVEPENGGERYQSLVSLEGNHLAECLGEYFNQSEQLKTKLWLSSDNNKAVGFMLQSLPAADVNKSHIMNNETREAGWQHATVLADTLSAEELLTLDVEVLLHRLYHEDDVRLFDAKKLRFECTCSQEKIENTILSIGETEAHEIVEEQGSISIDCEFCNTHYELDKVDLKRVFISSENDDDVAHKSIVGSSDVSGSVH